MPPSFNDLLTGRIHTAGVPPRNLEKGECQSPSSQRCRLCTASTLHYLDESRIKNLALHDFWEEHSLRIPADPLHPSPLGRGYRTVTKRKVSFDGKNVRLGLIDPSETGSGGIFNPVSCAIEPADHALIYKTIHDAIRKPYARPLAEQLSYVIVKGSYVEFTLILNVKEISTPLVRATNTMSKSLSHAVSRIVGVFLYEDPSGGRYYLGTSNPGGGQTVKKIFGKSEIFQRVLDKTFLFSPLSFSQVNQSLVGPLIKVAGDLLGLSPDSTLFDLYCGYGLFALSLAEKAGTVVGMERSAASVASGKENAQRLRATNVRFIRNDITPESLLNAMKNCRPSDAVLLDPPRGGTAEGVIETLAARRPGRIVHLFCDIDIMPAEIRRWEASGYVQEKVIPFDMFPGTSAIEVVTLLRPKSDRVV